MHFQLFSQNVANDSVLAKQLTYSHNRDLSGFKILMFLFLHTVFLCSVSAYKGHDMVHGVKRRFKENYGVS